MDETIILKCHFCQSDFHKSLKTYKNDSRKPGRCHFFCSLSCGAKHQMKLKRQKIIESYLSNPICCKECQLPIPFEKRHENIYCNSSCAAKCRNKNIKVETKCIVCYKLTKYGKLYCSKKCQKQKTLELKVDRLKRGIYRCNNNIRPILVSLRGHRCEDCKTYTWKDSPINLTIHHIDGDSQNNTLENLQLLCWNCHSMTPNYGRKNKKSTRKR